MLVTASTWTGATTRLDANKARQDNLAGLGRFVNAKGDLRGLARIGASNRGTGARQARATTPSPCARFAPADPTGREGELDRLPSPSLNRVWEICSRPRADDPDDFAKIVSMAD